MRDLAIIFVSVLVSLAGAFVVVRSIISGLDSRTKHLESLPSTVRNWVKAVNHSVEVLKRQVESSKNATLAAQLADLAAAVDADRARNRREFGRLWQRQRNEPADEHPDVDPELEAVLALQRATNGAGGSNA